MRPDLDPAGCKTTFCPPSKISIVTHIKRISLLKSKSFLHQKYAQEQLTINQIAVLTLSSRSTVIKYLRQSEIPIRAEDRRLGQSTFGMRKHKGRFVTHQQESELIRKMRALRDQGLSYRQIAEVMRGLNWPTKRGGKTWCSGVIHRILSRNMK